MPDVEDGSVRVDGHRIHYLRAGDAGPRLLLLHGGIIDAAHLSWGAVIKPLAEDHRVVAPDLLGYGESDQPAVDYTMERHVRTVEGFVDELDLAPVTVVGLSMGGGIGLGLALDSPDLLDRLVLVDSYGLGRDLPNGRLTYLLSRVQAFNKAAIAVFRRSRRAVAAGLSGIVHDVAALDPEVVDATQRLARQPGAGRAFRGFRASEVTRNGYRTTYVDRFPEVVVPTLLLHGAEDEVFPVDWARRAADRIPDAELHVLEACAHWPPRERPGEVVERIAAFVA